MKWFKFFDFLEKNFGQSLYIKHMTSDIIIEHRSVEGDVPMSWINNFVNHRNPLSNFIRFFRNPRNCCANRMKLLSRHILSTFFLSSLQFSYLERVNRTLYGHLHQLLGAKSWNNFKTEDVL